ncbi:hypothetical protein E2C01_043155 [Portunus trituberculatus]|uniref:Uncharacterized protein n=1 Tax=Portunus trituberculatus TaxID=210409 RepID=A0A5B7FUX9_PORTR|nr:hypothetical protein [Portunus trituberculatus]
MVYFTLSFVTTSECHYPRQHYHSLVLSLTRRRLHNTPARPPPVTLGMNPQSHSLLRNSPCPAFLSRFLRVVCRRERDSCRLAERWPLNPRKGSRCSRSSLSAPGVESFRRQTTAA